MSAPEHARSIPAHRAQAFTPVEKLEIVFRLNRVWSRHLGDSEHRVLSWLIDATVGWGNRSGRYSHAQMTSGIPDQSGGWHILGLPYSERQLRRIIASLRDKRAIFVTAEPGQKPAYTVNTDWSPDSKQEGSNVVPLPIPKRIRDAASTRVEYGTEGQWDEPHRTRTTKTGVSGGTPMSGEGGHRYPGRGDTDAPPYRGTDIGEHNGGTLAGHIRVRPRVVSGRLMGGGTIPVPVKPTTPPRPAYQTTLETVTTGRQINKLAVEKPKNARSAFAKCGALRRDMLHTAWTDAWNEAYASSGAPGCNLVCPVLTPKDKGHLDYILKHWICARTDPARAQREVLTLIDFVVPLWATIIHEEFAWMTKFPPPAQPTLGFLVKNLSRFMGAHAKHQRGEWVRSLTDREEAELQRLLDLGKTREAALLEIAERRALANDRQQREDDLRKVNERIRIAQRMEAATFRPTWTKENPHPDARYRDLPAFSMNDVDTAAFDTEGPLIAPVTLPEWED